MSSRLRAIFAPLVILVAVIVILAGCSRYAPPDVSFQVYPSPPTTWSIEFIPRARTGSGPVTEWVWRFGDGDAVTRLDDEHFVHDYPSDGVYTASLTGVGPGGYSEYSLEFAIEDGFVVFWRGDERWTLFPWWWGEEVEW